MTVLPSSYHRDGTCQARRISLLRTFPSLRPKTHKSVGGHGMQWPNHWLSSHHHLHVPTVHAQAASCIIPSIWYCGLLFRPTMP